MIGIAVKVVFIFGGILTRVPVRLIVDHVYGFRRDQLTTDRTNEWVQFAAFIT